MQNKIIWKGVFLILFGFLFFAIIMVTRYQCEKPVEKPNPEYVHGKPDTVFIKGKTDTLYIYRKSKAEFTKPAENVNNDSSYAEFPFSRNDSIKYELKTRVTTFPKCDSIKQSIDFSYLDKVIRRIDTVKIKTVDTLKIPYPVVKAPPLFADKNTYIGYGAGIITMGVFIIFLR